MRVESFFFFCCAEKKSNAALTFSELLLFLLFFSRKDERIHLSLLSRDDAEPRSGPVPPRDRRAR